MAIKPSLRFALLLILFHTIVATVVQLTFIPPVVRLAMILLILLSLFYSLVRYALLLFPDSWREITFDQGVVSVVTRDGSGFFGQVERKTVVSPYFAALHVRLERRHMPVIRIIFPDAMEEGEFRKLCVQLKFAQ